MASKKKVERKSNRNRMPESRRQAGKEWSVIQRECEELQEDIKRLEYELQENERRRTQLQSQLSSKRKELRRKKELHCHPRTNSACKGVCAPTKERSTATLSSKGGVPSKERATANDMASGKELPQHKDFHPQWELSGATPMQMMGHQVVGSTDKSHEDVKMMYEMFFSGEAVNIRRALKKELTSIKTKRLLSQTFKVIYDYVQREVVERLAMKSQQLSEGQQVQKSLKSEDRAGDITNDRQPVMANVPLPWKEVRSQDTALYTSRRDDHIEVRAEMIKKQRTYGILLHACNLVEMTDDRVEKETMDMREKLLTGNWASGLEDFEHANSIHRGLLDTYITSSVRLAFLMVTRIPPMIVVEATKFDPSRTNQDGSWDDSDDEMQQITSMQPILFFSYEGEVAVKGIVTNNPGSRGQDCVDDGHKAKVSPDELQQVGNCDGEAATKGPNNPGSGGQDIVDDGHNTTGKVDVTNNPGSRGQDCEDDGHNATGKVDVTNNPGSRGQDCEDDGHNAKGKVDVTNNPGSRRQDCEDDGHNAKGAHEDNKVSLDKYQQVGKLTTRC